MREKKVLQPELDFHPSNLKVTNEYYRKYEKISRTLDENPKIINLVHKDIGGILSSVKLRDRGGRPFKYATDTVIRILLCQSIENLPLRNIVIRIDDSHYLRRFVRIDSGPMMDFTLLDKLKNKIRPGTWKKVNQELAKYAVREELITGDSLRLDTTAVETNIHWPTDSSLLWDVYRVSARLVEQARQIDIDVVGNQRLHIKRVKKLYSRISRMASHKSPSSRRLIKRMYKKLIGSVQGIMDWIFDIWDGLLAGMKQRSYDVMDHAMAEALVTELEHYYCLGVQVIDQARRRVVEGEQVPNDEKLFSIFEPHTELLKRNKQNKSIEFGHMVEIHQVDEKFITGYEVFEKKPQESQQLKPALASHKKLFSDYPEIGRAHV